MKKIKFKTLIAALVTIAIMAIVMAIYMESSFAGAGARALYYFNGGITGILLYKGYDILFNSKK